MSDLVNLVLAGLRDKVVEDLKEENAQLSSRNAALTKSLLLEEPCFGRVEDATGMVLTRSEQFPDDPRCECCSWFFFKNNEDSEFPLKQFSGIKVYLGATPETPLSVSKDIALQQVTGHNTEANRVSIQFTDISLGVTLHVHVGPIPKEIGQKVFAKTPRKIHDFCDKILSVVPEATVGIFCMSIINEKAISLLTSARGQLTKSEAKRFLRIPNDVLADDAKLSEEDGGDSGDEAKDT